MKTANERLQACQDALKARGVKDVKFFFGSSINEKPLTELASDVADALELVVKGELRDLPPVAY